MRTELTSIERLSLRQLANSNYTTAAKSVEDHVMNRLMNEHGLVEWTGSRWQLSTKGEQWYVSLRAAEKRQSNISARDYFIQAVQDDESTLLDATPNRDDMARAMHDPTTLDAHVQYATQLTGSIVRVAEISIEALQQRIAELEAENAAYRGALEPFADAVRYDPDLMKARDNHSVYILNSDGDEYLFVETEQDELRVKHLRNAADVFNRYAEGASDEATD